LRRYPNQSSRRWRSSGGKPPFLTCKSAKLEPSFWGFVQFD
jgi:hypothetical protein